MVFSWSLPIPIEINRNSKLTTALLSYYHIYLSSVCKYDDEIILTGLILVVHNYVFDA
jgi:hypothetical protein